MRGGRGIKTKSQRGIYTRGTARTSCADETTSLTDRTVVQATKELLYEGRCYGTATEGKQNRTGAQRKEKYKKNSRPTLKTRVASSKSSLVLREAEKVSFNAFSMHYW